MRFRRTGRIVLSPIKEVELAAARLPGTVSLAQGIPSFDTPQVIKDYVAARMAEGRVAKYSLAPGLPALRDAVAESLARDGMRYDPDGEILITCGAIEAIASTLIAATDPGDEIILPSPSYASYQQVIRMVDCEPVFVPLDEERNFDLDVEAIARAITPRTAAIFYCNPNNPTGTIYSPEQTRAMLELAERHDLLIITDEVYKDFLYTPEPTYTPAMEEAARARVVRIFSFSKAYAMTGWRVGYLHSDRSVVNEILKVHDALVTCAPVVSQYAALGALEHGAEAVAEFRGAFRRRRDMALHHLDGLSHVFDYQKPNGSYFVFPRVKDTVPLSADSRALAMDLLEQARVALVPGVAFGPTGESHLRLSFGREEADIDEAFARMRGYFARATRTGAVPVPSGIPGTGGAPATPPDPVAAFRPPPAPAPVRPARSLPHRLLRGVAVQGLQLAARRFLHRRRPVVVAIAGNRGKTVVKRIVAGVLGPHLRLRANPRSYNTEIGLPLAVLGLEIDPRSPRAVAATLAQAAWRGWRGEPPADVLVLELGVRSPGDMAQLLRTVQPDWAVVTNLVSGEEDDPAVQAVLTEELALLLRRLPANHLLLSRDDSLLAHLRQRDGLQPALMARGDLRPRGGGHGFSVDGVPYTVGSDWSGDSSAYAFQAAAWLGSKLGLTPEQVQQGLWTASGGDPAAQAQQAVAGN